MITHSYRTSAMRLRTSVAASRPTVVCITAHCMVGLRLQAKLAMTARQTIIFTIKQRAVAIVNATTLFVVIYKFKASRKPGSVVDDNLSRTYVAIRLKPPISEGAGPA